MSNFPFLISGYWSEVSISDIDGDDSLDIVFFAQQNAVGTHLYVLNTHGDPLPGWPQIMPVHWFNHPAVADIDNDGTKEIIYNTWIDSLHCFRYDGTTQPGFPVESRLTPDCGISEVILCDIDDDNYIEIIVGSSTPWADTGCLYVYRWDGSHQPGWPKYFSDHIVFNTNQYHFSIGDINNDQEIEFIITGTGKPQRFLDKNGNYLPGAGKWQQMSINPVVANIDFTPEKEIITNGTSRGVVSAYYTDGMLCYGWPIERLGSSSNYLNDITVDDIDNDGLIELGVLALGGAGGGAHIHIWKLHGAAEDIEWGRPYYDLERTCHFRR